MFVALGTAAGYDLIVLLEGAEDLSESKLINACAHAGDAPCAVQVACAYASGKLAKSTSQMCACSLDIMLVGGMCT